MERLTMTPFGRQPVTAGLLAAQELATGPADLPRYAKWELFHQLCTARRAFGVSDRDLAVLNALLTFHRNDSLVDDSALVVFPSNRALSQRAHGMAESTLRRHLAALVRAGLLSRHDSPNGKRYARRGADGEIQRAFGFDLRPLLIRAGEIQDAARLATEAEAARIRRREACSLIVRDAVKFLIYGREKMPAVNWDALDDRLRLAQRYLRRKLDIEDLARLEDDLQRLLTEIKISAIGASATLEPSTQEPEICVEETTEMDGNADQSERHQHNSIKDFKDFEQSREQTPMTAPEPPIPLTLVLKACSEIEHYRPSGIEKWHDLVEAAAFLRGMMGITIDAWRQACQVMGPENASVTIACILERSQEIGSPGGYLRALTEKAKDGKFSVAPMVMAQLNRGLKQVA